MGPNSLSRWKVVTHKVLIKMKSVNKKLGSNIRISSSKTKITFLSIMLIILMGPVIQPEALSTQQTNEKKLTIFHVNDMHGWVEPHDGFGGMAHLLTQMETWGYNKDDTSSMLFSGGMIIPVQPLLH